MTLSESVLPKFLGYVHNSDLVSLACTSRSWLRTIHPILTDRKRDKLVIISQWKEADNYDDKIRNLRYTGDEPIPKDRLRFLTRLEFKRDFGRSFDHPMERGDLPNTLEHLTFGWNFNQKIGEGVLPPSLTHLTFGDRFNQPIGLGVLPPHLSHLMFQGKFDQPLEEGVLPVGLKHLTFGWNFNQEIGEGVLPDNLSHLTFGGLFNKPIRRRVLPESLKHLTFGGLFNQVIKEGVLPASLSSLVFGPGFKQPILGDLPDSLSYLAVGQSFLYIHPLNIVEGSKQPLEVRLVRNDWNPSAFG